jgi:hypothetical protein
VYASFDDAERGFFHSCLNLAWTNHGLPSDHDELRRLFKKNPTAFSKLWSRVGKKFYESDGRYYNRRQEQARTEAIEISEHNRRPGNANASKQKRERVPNAFQPERERVPRASLSSSLSSGFINLPKNGGNGFDAETGFRSLWEEYPEKGRVKAVLSMQYYVEEIHTHEEHEHVMAAVRGKWAASDKWRRGFILSLPEWIHQRCWDEEPESHEHALDVERQRKPVKESRSAMLDRILSEP